MSNRIKTHTGMVLIAVFLIVIGCCGFKFYLTEERAPSNAPAADNNLDSVHLRQQSSAASASTSSTSHTEQVVVKPGMTKAELNAQQNWMRQRGFFNSNENDDYKQYDEQTLKKLADTGDIHAMQLLANLLYSRSSYKEAVDLYKKSAVYGSTYSVQFLVGEEGRRSMIDESLNMHQPPEVKKSRVLTALAYAKVAEMRGDSGVYFRSLMAPTIANPSQIQLTDEDYERVQPLAQQIYDDLQKQRMELGLGEFDNSVPPEVIDGFKRIDPRIFNGVKAKY